MRFQNRSILITGGASGIGLATALAFGREGARVTISDLSEEGGRRALERAAADRLDLRFVPGDVSKDADAARMVADVIERCGTIDVLFNNAGIIVMKTLHELTEEEWDRSLDVNLKGMFLVSRHAVPAMLRQGRGIIVNTASVNGIVGSQGYPAYCASKGGVALLTKAMALDYARHGIRVNAVCPGWVETAMFHHEAATRGTPIEEYRRAAIAETPLGRVGRPEDVASAVLYLASDEASYVTGSLLVVDGGLTAV